MSTRLNQPTEMSPRAWGWTGSARPEQPGYWDVPTRVGVDRQQRGAAARGVRCPHARGGGPMRLNPLFSLDRMSPRAWGWTERGRPFPQRGVDVPTRVGVDRFRPGYYSETARCPHARGGGPLTISIMR